MWRTHLAGFSVQFVVCLCSALAVIKLMPESGAPRRIRNFNFTFYSVVPQKAQKKTKRNKWAGQGSQAATKQHQELRAAFTAIQIPDLI